MLDRVNTGASEKDQENLLTAMMTYYLHSSFYHMPVNRALFLSLVSQNKETGMSESRVVRWKSSSKS